LLVVSWDKGAHDVLGDNDFMMSSCSGIFTLGDIRARILADLRKCMDLITTGLLMSIDPAEVELTRSLSIVRAPLQLRQDCAFGIEERVFMALID
jgi:hypothetical protein